MRTIDRDEPGQQSKTESHLPILQTRAKPTRKAPEVDAAELADYLARRIDGEVRFDEGSRALYATDGSNYRQVPIGVVIPRTLEDVITTVSAARLFGAPLLSRGGGTSLAGQCCNVAVVMDFSKYLHRILALDPIGRTARVEPGLVLDDLRNRAEEHHLTFAPDPSTHTHCTLGGMIGNNSCGLHSVMGGKTVENVIELDVLTGDGVRLSVGETSEEELESIIRAGGARGTIYQGLKTIRDRYAQLIRARYPRIPRRVSGYNLDQLLPESGFNVARALVGTEGTCVTVLSATVRLVHSPPHRSLLVLGYPSVYEAGDHVSEVLEAGPIGLEGIDDRLVEDMKKKKIHPQDLKLLPDGAGWLLVEFGGETREEADAQAHRLMDSLRRHRGAPEMKLYDDKKEEELVWKIRESGLGATARVPGSPDTWEGFEDSAVPPERVGEYLRALRTLFEKHHYQCALYGHFGQGCIHTRIDFELKTAEGIRKFRAFKEDASDLVLSFGGSLSGEHGDGQSRGELLPKMFGPELVRAFGEFKALWDPDNRMNPGKVVDPYRLDENLRYGADYDPPQPATWFQYPDDKGSFSYATERCVGVGKCRREESGTMCPSYMVTREEAHSTRGRAHLLFEMLKGDPIGGGWRDEHVKESLDLCLACKGCKGDCPMNVDMATYKAEFLSHYYEGRIRPRTAYSMGLIHRWAQVASLVPNLANLMSHSSVTAPIFKALGGIAQDRDVPAFAPETFQRWFAKRPAAARGGPSVVLFPDTFNNHFHPYTARAAVTVLEAAGFTVKVPRERVCCGRPLYDFGMLDTAKSLLEQLLRTLKTDIEAGATFVGLEPSCLAVLKDELINLMPNREDARRLSNQTMTLGEFLTKRAPDFQLPALAGRAIVQGHCHHKAVLDFDSDNKVLKRLGLDFEVLDSGCCGMAGSFGFEADKYDVSMKCGERVLLPSVRRADPATLVIADGFSCREQIRQGTERDALHIAEVLELALSGAEWRTKAAFPERVHSTAEREIEEGMARASRWVRVGLVALAVGAAMTALRSVGRGRRMRRLRRRRGARWQ